MREFDILLFSEEDLTDGGRKSVRRSCDAAFLLKMKQNPDCGKFLGMVCGPRKKDKNYVMVKVDIGYD